MRYQTEATSLVDALGVQSWPFHRVDAALDWLFALEMALFEAREDEFVRAELRAAGELPTNRFDDNDIPF